MLRLAVPFLALALALAGCSDDGDGDAGGDDPDGGAEAGMGASFDSIPAPQWEVGQWWEWESTFPDGTRDETFCSIVLSTGPDHVLVTEQDGMAKEAAAFGHPLLAPVRAGDLAMGGWGDAPWSVLSFPLTDGKTWTGTIPNIAWDIFLPADTVEATFTATFSDAPAGTPPVVAIVGMVGDAKVMDAEYDPATGWFRTLTFYDVDPGQDPLEVRWAAASTGLNYTGPYFHHSARQLLQLDERVGFSDVPTEGGQPYTQAPQPHWTFTMGEGTSLYGYLAAESVAGTRAIVLVDPANGQRVVASSDQPEGEQFLFLDEPGMAGEWKLETVGVGGFSGAFGQLHEITAVSSTM